MSMSPAPVLPRPVWTAAPATTARALPVSAGSHDTVTGSVRIVKDGDGPVVEPPVTVKVECAGSPSDEEKAKLADEIQGRIQRQLRFKAEVMLFNEGDLPAEYGPTGKAKLLE